jgi:CheY-like chemotaxis protein
VKMLWCWRCKVEMPMLDEAEAQQVFSKNDGPDGLNAMLAEYERVTGYRETNPNAIYHHVLSQYGPPCQFCGKPLRTPQAIFCGSCMKPVAKRKRGTVLVVDDEAAMRDIISGMLDSAGYECRAVAGGSEALALLDSGVEVSVVMHDLLNAPMDGIALLERLTEKHPSVPVIVATAVHDLGVARACFQHGAYDYLLEPFEREQLLTTVHRALRYRRLKQRNSEKAARLAAQEQSVRLTEIAEAERKLKAPPAAMSIATPQETSSETLRPRSRSGIDVSGALWRIYEVGAWITGILTFIVCWVYAIASYGFLLGVGLGWLPSAIVAVIAAYLWPLLLLLVILLVLYFSSR